MAYNKVIPQMDQSGLTVFVSGGICMCKQETPKNTIEEREPEWQTLFIYYAQIPTSSVVKSHKTVDMHLNKENVLIFIILC